MFKKLVLVQVILLLFQTLLYFGCEFFQGRIHDVKRSQCGVLPDLSDFFSETGALYRF